MEQERHASDSSEPAVKRRLASGYSLHPCVKYLGIGLGLVTLFAIDYAAFKIGHDRGFEDGVTSRRVQESVNEAAIRNLEYILQIPAASDEELLQCVAQRQEKLGWITDPMILAEAEWALASTLISRGLAPQAGELMAELFGKAEQNAIWARRVHLAARSLAAGEQRESSLAYYRQAISRYTSLSMKDEQLSALTEMAELIAVSDAPANEIVTALEPLLKECEPLGEAARPLSAHILAYTGRLYRENGNLPAALSNFEKALSLVSDHQGAELGTAAASYGSALLEKGDREQAEKYLRTAVACLGDSPSQAVFLIAALRDLATIEMEKDASESALALLYRAEGVATGRESEDSPFWSFLYDQRGWVHFTRQSFESAAGDFERALSVGQEPAQKVQAHEGLGRCYIELDRPEDAIAQLQTCISLREQAEGADTRALGRVYFLLAEQQDQVGQSEAAATSYQKAIANLALHQECAQELFLARISCAYCLTQLSRWAEAVTLWKELLPIVEQSYPERLHEVRQQLRLCSAHDVESSSVDPDDPEEPNPAS